MNTYPIQPGQKLPVIVAYYYGDLPAPVPEGHNPQLRLVMDPALGDAFALTSEPDGRYAITANGSPDASAKVECVLNFAPDGRPPISQVIGSCAFTIIGDANRAELRPGEPIA